MMAMAIGRELRSLCARATVESSDRTVTVTLEHDDHYGRPLTKVEGAKLTTTLRDCIRKGLDGAAPCEAYIVPEQREKRDG